jgi:DNA-binding transcriptional LysR family regulator
MLDALRYFQSIVQTRSFTQAAYDCHISQSAISQQIKSLELSLGVKLIDRSSRKIELTKAGQYFYEKSLILVADYDRLVEQTVRIASQNEHEFTIGYLNRYEGMALAKAIAKLSHQEPDLTIHTFAESHDGLYKAMQSGKADLIFNDQRRAFSDLYCNYSLGKKPLQIEVSAHNPISHLKSIEVSELKNTPCILISTPQEQETEKEYYSDILQVESDFIFAPDLASARLLASQNKGFLPLEPSASSHNSVTKNLYLTLQHQPVDINYCCFWKKENNSSLHEKFAYLLHQEFLQEEKEALEKQMNSPQI